jgi:hypothetical protein
MCEVETTFVDLINICLIVVLIVMTIMSGEKSWRVKAKRCSKKNKTVRNNQTRAQFKFSNHVHLYQP